MPMSISGAQHDREADHHDERAPVAQRLEELLPVDRQDDGQPQHVTLPERGREVGAADVREEGIGEVGLARPREQLVERARVEQLAAVHQQDAIAEYSASPMTCVEKSTARPAARSRRMASTMNCPLMTSRAVVGSSRMRTSGL